MRNLSLLFAHFIHLQPLQLVLQGNHLLLQIRQEQSFFIHFIMKNIFQNKIQKRIYRIKQNKQTSISSSTKIQFFYRLDIIRLLSNWNEIIIILQFKYQKQDMILLTIVALLIVYTVTAFIRRKLVKPNYSGQIIWITGASSGLGEYLTYEFNRLGAYVIISARNKKQLERVKKQCTFSENVEVVPMDMIEYEKVRLITQKVLKKLQDKGQKLDMVIQNAGLSMRCEFIHYSFQNHKNLFEINVNGPYNHLQAILPHFIKHKGGKIVGVTSLAGKISTAFRSSYAGSKHAFIGILDSLRCEFRQYNIKVCNLMPGYVRTNLSKNAFAGKTGEKFGKTDLNIQNGMDPAKFARQSVGAIYLDQNEISVSETWLHILGLIFRNLIPDLIFYLQYKNSINQARAVSEAKTQ